MSLGVEVKLLVDFSVVKETLERVGVRNREEKKFFPSCYIVDEKDGTYRIYHFKELFKKEGNKSTYDDLDMLRRNTIVFLLKNWGLVDVVNKDNIEEIQVKKIDVISHKEKREYKICHKYLFKRKVKI